MTRQELQAANEALLARRKREGLCRQPILPTSPAATWEEYFATKADLDRPHIINGGADKWREFDSDRNPILKRAVKTIGLGYDLWLDTGAAIILAGNCGCGKTHLAQAIYKMFGFGAVYLNEVDMVQQIQASYDGSGKSLEDFSRSARRAKLLIYDDLGAYQTDNTPWLQNIYMKLFDGRKEAGNATIVTTNLRLIVPGGASPLAERMGQRTYSRLMGQVEELRFFIDLFNVPDYRLRNF